MVANFLVLLTSLAASLHTLKLANLFLRRRVRPDTRAIEQLAEPKALISLINIYRLGVSNGLCEHLRASVRAQRFSLRAQS